MNFLETILSDLDKLEIPHEEHYDPGGMDLHVMNIRDHANPTLIHSDLNPNQVLLSVFIIYAPPKLSQLDESEKERRELIIKQLGLQIGLLHKIAIRMDVFHASIGIILDARDYSIHKLKAGIPIVMGAYDRFIYQAVRILHWD